MSAAGQEAHAAAAAFSDGTSPAGADAEGSCVYLFCCAAPCVAASLDGEGLRPGQKMYMVPLGDLAAVACDVPLADWTGPAGEANLADLSWLAPCALRHQAVLEQAMESAPVLPLPVGTLFSSPTALLLWLAQRYQRITGFLSQMANKEEWSIKLLLDAPRAEQHWLAADPRLAQLGAGGARYLLEKKLRTEASQRSRQAAKQAELELLNELAPSVLLRRPRRILAQHSPDPSHQVVAHSALLLHAEHRAALLEAIARFNAEHADAGLQVEATGPWPAASFAPDLTPDT